MAKIFLDTNKYIDFLGRDKNLSVDLLDMHNVYISPLSIHIVMYIYKYSVPSDAIEKSISLLNVVQIDSNVTIRSLKGPTSDFEDNIQLQSAALVNTDIFLTSDKKLLKMKYFGKVEIMDVLQ